MVEKSHIATNTSLKVILVRIQGGKEVGAMLQEA